MLDNPFDSETVEADEDVRRRETRLLALFPTFYAVDGGRRRTALCIDMSVSGMRLATHVELEQGKTVNIQMFVGDDQADVWEFDGIVARVEPRKDARYWSHQVGIRFDTPALSREAQIEALALEYPGQEIPEHD
jgi:hypothetical protein